MAYTLDEFLKLNKGYTKGYNPTTKNATVTNTNTGKSINFQSGQGSDYGFGGIENDSNVISDLSKFNTSLASDKPVQAPVTQAPVTQAPTNAYTSPYSQQITDTLSSLSNRPAFNYNASSDQGLASAQENAMSTVSREAARRGMLYSDSNKSQLGKSSMALIPQFEASAYNKYQQQGTDLTNQLNTLSGLETGNYNQFNKERSYATDQATQKKSDFIDTIGASSSNYQAKINELQNDNDTSNDWQVPYYQTARQDKIANQESAQATAISEAEIKSYDEAMTRWKTTGKVQPQDEQVLGVKAGTPTADTRFKEAELALDTIKSNYDNSRPYFNPKTGSSSTDDAKLGPYISSMLASSDPMSFIKNNSADLTAKEIETLVGIANDFKVSDPPAAPEASPDSMVSDTISAFSSNRYSDNDALSELSSNASAYISDMGLSAYNKLLAYYQNRLE